MKLYLNRKDVRADGFFGELLDERGELIAITLEHYYVMGPKLKAGEYVVKKDFSPKFQCDLFEVQDVPGASEIKFHIGNYNEDSEGCVLLGSAIGHKLNGGRMITNSKIAFDKFMTILKDVDSFVLKVSDLEPLCS